MRYIGNWLFWHYSIIIYKYVINQPYDQNFTDGEYSIKSSMRNIYFSTALL